MAIYHVNQNGETGVCRATVGTCPYGGPEDHFLNREDAARSYELKQNGSFETEELVLIHDRELRIIDARLLAKAKELADAETYEAREEIQAITEPLAIIREARVVQRISWNPFKRA